jgi:DNA-binding beta-propeller fold protein YncE
MGLAWQAPAAFGADTVYWSNEGSNAHPISFAALDGSGGGNLQTTGAPANLPAGVAIDSAAGKVYWANESTGKISYASLDGSGGGELNTAGATVAEPFGVAIDEATGRLYWGNAMSNTHPISWANLDGSGGGDLPTAGASAAGASGLALDPAAGKVYWVNGAYNATHPISYANLDGSGGGNLNTTGTTSSLPAGVAVDDADGRIYWTNQGPMASGDGWISYARLDNTGGGGQLNLHGATIGDALGIAIDAAAGKLYWANGSASSAVSYARLDGSGGGTLSTTGATGADGVLPALLKSPVGTAQPTINGGPTVGSTLSCSRGTWSADVVGAFLFRAPHTYAYQWTLNGADIPGATSSTYTPASAGSYACRVTASNQAGSTSETSAWLTVTASATPPLLALSQVGQSHRRWREGNALPHIAQARKAPVGTTFRFALNQAATAQLAFTQRLAGRRVHGHCVVATSRNRHKPRCTRSVPRGSLSVTVGAGSHSLRFQGRISKRKLLRPGGYTLLVTATDALGQRSTARLNFTIVG